MRLWMPCARVFNVVSIATTTGTSTADYLQWPVFAPVSMLLLSGWRPAPGPRGRIKMVRVLILKQARREMTPGCTARRAARALGEMRWWILG